MTAADLTAAADGARASAAPRSFGTTPPGERYFRHPGDVVRLVLWSMTAVLLTLVLALDTDTADGITADLGRIATGPPAPVRELLLALAQVTAIIVPLVAAGWLVAQRRWRRLGMAALAAAAGALTWWALATVVDVTTRGGDALGTDTWIASTKFPSLAFLTAATTVATVGKPWLGRSWRRATDVGVGALAVVMAIEGRFAVPELLLALVAGAAVGAALLVAFGAPNRRATELAIAEALGEQGYAVSDLTLERAVGGRSQLYSVDVRDGDRLFVKVYGRDTRDADLIYRGYRALLLREPNDSWPAPSLKLAVEREAFMLLMANQGGVASPSFAALTSLQDGSVLLALEHVGGHALDDADAGPVDDAVLDATWGEVRALHSRRIAHRALRAANVLVTERGPVIVDMGFADESASPRLRAIDRAELLASLVPTVGVERAVASARRVLPAEELAATLPYLQPLALSARTRQQVTKAGLHDVRAAVVAATDVEPIALERLTRVRPRALLTIAALVGAFYLLLPQLANVDDSVSAIQDANWGWLAVVIAMSALTYVFGAIGMAGGVPIRLPFVPNLEAQVASSFVNRITPANVGGMALNVRFLQKAGTTSAEAVTGVGLNSFVGAIVHFALLVLFFAWARRDHSNAFSVPSGTKALAIGAIALALAGVFVATRRGRHVVRARVVPFVRQAVRSILVLGRSPAKLAALLGGSLGVTIAYITAFAASVAAFHGDVSYAQVGAVYLGASALAAAAPTPGGLGALEAGLVAGLTGVGMASGPAVAAVLSYRLATYWLPVLPGWASFHLLERRGLI